MEERKESYLELKPVGDSISVSRGGVSIASIPADKFGFKVKSNKKGIDILNRLKVTAGGFWNEILVNGESVTAENASELIGALIKTCSGGGEGGSVSFSDITGSPDSNAALSQKFGGYVAYTEEKNIVLENDHKLLGTDLNGVQHNLAECSRFTDNGHPIIDMGGAGTHFNTNSVDRPTCQIAAEPGENAHHYAFLEDFTDQNKPFFGDLSTTGSSLTVKFGKITALISKISTTEVQVRLLASTETVVDITSTQYEDAVPNTKKYHLTIPADGTTLSTILITNVKRLSALVVYEDQIYTIEGSGNDDYSLAYVIVTRYI